MKLRNRFTLTVRVLKSKFLPVWGMFLTASLMGVEAQKTLSYHIPDAAMRSLPIRRLDKNAHLRLILSLPLRNPEVLTNLIDSIYSPKSAGYHRYLTPDQFAERFGPTQEDYEKAICYAVKNGLRVTKTHRNRTLLNIEGTVGDIEKTFSLQMNVHAHPLEHRTFFAPSNDPSVDQNMPIASIAGLDDFDTVKRVGAGMVPSNGIVPCGSGSGPNGALMASDLRNAYVPGSPLTGAGQTVALVEFDGYYTNDVAAYAETNGLPYPNLTNVLVETVSDQPSQDVHRISEVTLDIEMIMAMAPGISKINVYEAPSQAPAGLYEIDILNTIANDNSSRQISCSWIYYGITGNDKVILQIQQQFAAQGQAFFQGSGDWGAYWNGMLDIGFGPHNGYPALGSPYITHVGGTKLTTDGPGGPWTGETTWIGEPGHGSSGAIAYAQIPIPGWQKWIDMSSNGGSTTVRNMPDVSMVAENIWTISNNGIAEAGSGTSFSAPLWAGFTALVNQQAEQNGLPPVGCINPALYAIAKGPQYLDCFHDITTGNNTNAYSPDKFFATPGYDLCTGLGTPTGTNLMNALAPFDSLKVLPTNGFEAIDVAGGTVIRPSSQDFSVTNRGTSLLHWSLTHSDGWLLVAPDTGVLNPGEAVTIIRVELNSNAVATLPPGFYSSSLTFSNLDSGFAIQRMVTLQLGQNLVKNGGFETGSFQYWDVTNIWEMPPNKSTFPSMDIVYYYFRLFSRICG